MSYAKDREEFIHRCATWGLPLEAVRLLMRDAGIIQRAAEVDCSVSNHAIRQASLRAASAAEKRIRRIVHDARAFGAEATVTFGGDPRGACVKIKRTPDDKGDSWGEDGWCVPAQGYRASQMERMAR